MQTMGTETVRMYLIMGSYIVADDQRQAIQYYNVNEVGSGKKATPKDVIPVIQLDIDEMEEEKEGTKARLSEMEADLEKPFLFGRIEQRWDLMPALAGPNPFEAQN